MIIHLYFQFARMTMSNISTSGGLCYMKLTINSRTTFVNFPFERPFILEFEKIKKYFLLFKSSTRSVLCNKVFSEISQNPQENICARISFLIKLQASACNFIKKETLTQVFSREFCKISKNTFFIEHLRTTASAKASHF